MLLKIKLFRYYITLRNSLQKEKSKRLTPRQLEYIKFLRKYLYDPNSRVYMSPDYERYIENYDEPEENAGEIIENGFSRKEKLSKGPTYFIYLTDGGYNTRIPGFSGMEIKNHNDHFMEYYDEKQLEAIYIEVDKEIRKRRIEMYDFATQNIINRLKELSK